MVRLDFKTSLLQRECFFTQKITMNGMIFAIDQWLPDFNQNKKIHEIFDIIVTDD